MASETLQIEIRKLQEEDIEPLSRIEAESFSKPWSPQDFRDLLGRDYCVYLVALAEGEVAGCCGMTNVVRRAILTMWWWRNGSATAALPGSCWRN